MKVGDLVKRDVWPGYFQIMEMYRNEYLATRIVLLNLVNGKYITDIRPSHVKVLS